MWHLTFPQGQLFKLKPRLEVLRLAFVKLSVGSWGGFHNKVEDKCWLCTFLQTNDMLKLYICFCSVFNVKSLRGTLKCLWNRLWFLWWLLMSCNTKRDHQRTDCWFYIVINVCSHILSHRKTYRLLPHCDPSWCLCHSLPKQLAKIFTTTAAGVVPLLSKGGAGIDKNWKFFVDNLMWQRCDYALVRKEHFLKLV